MASEEVEELAIVGEEEAAMQVRQISWRFLRHATVIQTALHFCRVLYILLRHFEPVTSHCIRAVFAPVRFVGGSTSVDDDPEQDGEDGSSFISPDGEIFMDALKGNAFSVVSLGMGGLASFWCRTFCPCVC